MASKTAAAFRAAIYLVVMFLLTFHQLPLGAKDEKMKPEELIEKHLASIGTPDARAAARTRMAVGARGSGQINFIQPAGRLIGTSEIVSEGKRMRISMMMADAPNYPSEQYAFDGDKANTSQVRPGVRVNMAYFAYTYDVMLKEGLLGGTMTTAWALLDVSGRQPKIEYRGLKKVDGVAMHELKYTAKKGSKELQVWLRFDPETFRHLQSEYRLTLPPGMASSPTESSSQRDTYYSVREYFDDFRTVDGVTLPYSWKLKYSREGMGPTVICEYIIALDQVVQNKSLDPKSFALREQ